MQYAQFLFNRLHKKSRWKIAGTLKEALEAPHKEVLRPLRFWTTRGDAVEQGSDATQRRRCACIVVLWQQWNELAQHVGLLDILSTKRIGGEDCKGVGPSQPLGRLPPRDEEGAGDGVAGPRLLPHVVIMGRTPQGSRLIEWYS